MVRSSGSMMGSCGTFAVDCQQTRFHVRRPIQSPNWSSNLSGYNSLQAVTLHTSLGDIKLELACSQVPRLCENFLALAACGTYDSTLFHRNIKGFIVQGGDPTGTGKGGESIHGGKLPDEFASGLSHEARGVVAMANNGRDTNGCQFYIAYAACPSLDGQYCVIGRVIDGWTTLDAMEAAPVAGKKCRPVNDIVIKGVTIHANPFARP